MTTLVPGGNAPVATGQLRVDISYTPGIPAQAHALRRGSMFDVMEQQRCYAAGQSP